MNKLALVLALFLSPVLHASSSFPRLSLYSLKGEQRSLPSGKKELVFVGCKGGVRQALTRWYQAFRDYQDKVGCLNVIVVPVFPSFMANRFLRPSLMALIRQRIPEHLSHHVGVLFSNSDETAALFQLSQGELENLQVFLVDETGTILWQASGGPTSQHLHQLKQLIQ